MYMKHKYMSGLDFGPICKVFPSAYVHIPKSKKILKSETSMTCEVSNTQLINVLYADLAVRNRKSIL